MRMKSVTVGVLLVMVLGLLAGAGSAFAASPAAGSGPDSAAAPRADWQPLAVGQRMWYAFNYAGDGSQIEITMQADPAGSVNFAVWTPGELQSWQQTGVESPVGRGTDNAALGDAYDWSGNFNTPGTYYIVIDSAANVPATYQMTVTGTGVSFPAPAAAPASAATSKSVTTKAAVKSEPASEENAEISKAESAETAAVAKSETSKMETALEQAKETAGFERAEAIAAAPQGAQNAQAAAAAPAAAMGTGPGNAVQATGNDMGAALQPGQVRWYAFQAAGGNSQIILRLTSDPANAATFSVWTQDELRQLNDTGVEAPVGRGTENDFYNGDQVWVGSFTDGGTYFVRVEQTGPATANGYQLQMMQ